MLRLEAAEHAKAPQLRQLAKRELSRQGVATIAEQVLVTTGGQQALALLAQLLVAPSGVASVTATPSASCRAPHSRLPNSITSSIDAPEPRCFM